jgi:hypothetical protein
MESKDELATCRGVGAGLPAGKRQEIAVPCCKKQIAAEAEAISRLRDKRGRLRSKRRFVLAMASSS